MGILKTLWFGFPQNLGDAVMEVFMDQLSTVGVGAEDDSELQLREGVGAVHIVQLDRFGDRGRREWRHRAILG